MLPDERTTHNNTLSLPSDVEGLVAAPGRGVARPLVDFLRGQGINVQTTSDADAAIEEALLHPPDIVLIDDRLPPAGGIELCQRLKSNVRTHFVPVIVWAPNDERSHRIRAYAAGADAVFGPSSDAQERRTRLWALLRTRALYRQLEKKQRAQGTEIVDRRRWLGNFLHDLQGQVAALSVNVDYLAKHAPAKGDVRLENFLESIEDVRTVFAQLVANVRTVQDYDRYETNRLVPQETSISLGDVAAEVADDLRRQASASERSFTFARPPADSERKVQGDRELLRRAMLNLGMSAMRRSPGRSTVAMSVSETDSGTLFRVTVPGEGLQGADRLNVFEPYAPRSVSAAGYGLGLALARAIVELHEGHLWIEDVPEGGCAFVFDLKWQRRGPQAKRPNDNAASSNEGPGPA
ncbi:MAG TPA: hybrid sensor histidine kinase/response regulator [Polyangia bacterium]|jgi:signal transduction histidine kinase|nr:hybrid sensor histidine kinase/response regulator [Polyangia bacterium]